MGCWVIQTGTMQVTPSEVDETLLLHPDVEDAATFPVADAKFDAVVGAVVVLRPGAFLRPRDLKWFVSTHLSCFKVPQRIVIADSIPAVPRRALAQALGLASSVCASSIFSIQEKGRGAPLYVVGASEGLRIRSERPVFGIREPEIAQLPPPHTLEHVAANCVHALRRFQADGPYALAASEASRAVAIEMARQLEQAAESVDFVALFKSSGVAGPRLPYDRRHSWAGRAVDAALVAVE